MKTSWVPPILGFVLFVSTAQAQVLPRIEFFFPQLADGKIDDDEEFRTILVLKNHNDSAATGKLALFSDDGNPMAMRFRDLFGNTIIASEINFTIPARGLFQITSAGTQSNLLSGYGKVTSNMPISGLAIFGEFEIEDDGEIEIESQAAVEATGTMRAFAVTDFREEDSATGLAVVNASETNSTTLTLTKFDPSGNQVDRATIQLGPRQHRAFFLSEVLTRAPNVVVGLVIVESSATDVSAIALKFDDEEDEDEFTAAPVTQIR